MRLVRAGLLARALGFARAHAYVLALAASLALACGASQAALAAAPDAWSPPATGAAVPKRTPEADLRDRRAFMLVVVEPGNRLKRSEAYGDWQAYLQAFTDQQQDSLPVHQVSVARARSLVANWPRGLRSATLFANRRGAGLLHRGLVLEPRVYLIGQQFAQGAGVAADAASFGLEPFSLRRK